MTAHQAGWARLRQVILVTDDIAADTAALRSAFGFGGGFHDPELGDYEMALRYCQQALALQQELGYRRGEAAAWDSLGVAYHHLGRYAVAVAAYQQALTLFRDQGNRYNEADTLVHLGETYHASGDTDAARGRWRAALAIFADLDHPDAEQVRVRLRDTP